jgi:tetraacyldisaccharide 4'-kinase
LKRPLLIPFTPLYAAGLAFRNWRIESGREPVRRLRFPVVSIGNLSTGGSGKTPLTIALARALQQRGFRVDVLSRGYGRKSKLAARVKADGVAEDFGDEPLMIARQTGLPVYVAPRRYDAGVMAEADLPQSVGENDPPIVHLLDDGFQHRQLARQVDILLLDRRDWQDRLLPAGDLREPLKAVRRASIIAIPADDLELEAELRAWGWQNPIWRIHRTMEVPFFDGPVAAFCGIARQEQFFLGLEAAGVKLALRRAFPDHFPYTRAVLEELLAKSRAAGATAFVTTEKDLVRLGRLASIFLESIPRPVRLSIEIQEQEVAIDWIVDQIAPSFTSPLT